MKHITVILFFWIGLSMAVSGQSNPRIILHLQSDDSLVHRSIVSQIANLKKAIPDGEVEVLCHGPGLSFMMKRNPYINRILAKNASNITFVGCEFTMSQRNIKKEDLIQTAITVPYGIAEIV